MANMSMTKNPMPTQEPLVRARNFDEVATGYTEEQVKDEAARCLQCKNPSCRKGCPVNTDIPGAIKLLREGHLIDAGKQLFENNPLSLICAIVCNHGRQCEGHCVRGIKGDPVHWGYVERYISDTCLDRMEIPCAPATGRQVAIIGGGPAGLTAAVELMRKGHEVTIFEAESQLGGMLRYGIPDFRLPNRILDRYTNKHLAQYTVCV